MRVMTGSIKRKYEFVLVERGGLGIPLPIGYAWAGLVVMDLATVPHLLVGGIHKFRESAFSVRPS